MALNTSGQVKHIADRFGIAQDEPTPEDITERQDMQRKIRTGIYEVAVDIVEEIEGSRESEKALEHLEEALMWAGKAIFKD